MDVNDKGRIIRLLNNYEFDFHADGRKRNRKTCLTRNMADAIMDEFPITAQQLIRLYRKTERDGQLTNHVE